MVRKKKKLDSDAQWAPASGPQARMSPSVSCSTNGCVHLPASATHTTSEDENLKTASPWTREFDFAETLYTPHTVLCLVTIFFCLLLALRYYYYPDMGVVPMVKLGLSAAVFTFIGFGAVNLPDSLMVRPHPAVWRAVLACGVLYLVFLTFLLFLDLSTVKELFALYDPQLRHPLPERTYAEDCRIATETNPFLFFHTSFDTFIIAHALGYVVKALILRNWRMVTCLSLGFEVIEVTFQHILPNFRECWWDHLLLDVLLCNTGGTVVGMWLLGRLKAKKYHWIALKEIGTVKGKARRVLGQLGPRSFTVYQWNAFETPKRFLQVSGILLLLFVQEMNCFTMKAILNMSPNHHLVFGRLLLWSLLAIPGLREYYEFMGNRHVRRIGTTAWVATFCLALETAWITKMMVEGQYFQQPMPLHVLVPWYVITISLVVWFVLFFWVVPLRQRQVRSGVCYSLVNVFFYAAAAAMLALFCMGMPDLQIGRQAFENLVCRYERTLTFWRL